MSEPTVSITRLTWLRLWNVIRLFLKSDVGHKAIWLLVSLLALLLGINFLNVVNSFVGRYFMSAIEMRDHGGFVRHAFQYAAVFAASTVVAVVFRFTEERLGLLWREWLSRRLVEVYMGRRVYLHMQEAGNIANPDQRISEDTRSLTVTTLSFLLMIVSGSVTAVSFSGVLWSISPLLFGVAVGYAVVGSMLTIQLGRPLIRLNYRQSDMEANFRSELIQVREHVEAVALQQRQAWFVNRLMRRIDGWAGNFRRIISVNRNLGFFTTGYNYLIQLIPALFVAPMFIRGEVEFGVIGQAAMAFATLLGAFSLVVTQFQSISSYASVIARLAEMVEEVDRLRADHKPAIATNEAPDRIAFDRLTLRASGSGAVVLRELSISIPQGMRVCVTGDNGQAKEMLFRTVAGLCDSGGGSITRPPSHEVAFLPEQPFLPPCSLRELVTPAGRAVSEEEIAEVLGALGIADVMAKAGGCDCEQQWEALLTLSEEQLVAVACLMILRPKFALLQRLGASLEPKHRERVLDLLAQRGISCIVIGNGDERPANYDAVLELHADASWRWRQLRP